MLSSIAKKKLSYKFLPSLTVTGGPDIGSAGFES
jgi:hypothetical protein